MVSFKSTCERPTVNALRYLVVFILIYLSRKKIVACTSSWYSFKKILNEFNSASQL